MSYLFISFRCFIFLLIDLTLTYTNLFMNRCTLLVLNVLLFFSTSCKDEIINESSSEIRIRASYETSQNPGLKHPDFGSKVYIYYGIHTLDLMGYAYEGSGHFVKGDSVILPDQTTEVDDEGSANIYPMYTDKKITIIVDSNFYKERQVSSSYPSFKEKIILQVVFQP